MTLADNERDTNLSLWFAKRRLGVRNENLITDNRKHLLLLFFQSKMSSKFSAAVKRSEQLDAGAQFPKFREDVWLRLMPVVLIDLN